MKTRNLSAMMADLFICLCLLLICPVLFSKDALAQKTIKNPDGSTTFIETYPDGRTRSQETTTPGPNGRPETIRTEYDESGRPTRETHTTYGSDYSRTVIEKTWVYDGQGRLIFFLYEKSYSSGSPRTDPVPGSTQKYRKTTRYADDKDQTGKSKKEEYSSVDGKWHEIEEGDQAIFSNPERLQEPTQKLNTTARETSKPTPTPAFKTDTGYKFEAANASGLYVATLTTPRGKIIINLTDDLASGDTFTGTVQAQPAGRTDAERARSQAELSGTAIEVGGRRTGIAERSFTGTIPATLTPEARQISIWLGGKMVATMEVPASAAPSPTPTEFQLPTGGQQGRPVEIRGSFDGRFTQTDYVRIGGRDVSELAESPRKKVVRNSIESVGQTEIECREHGAVTKGEFRSLALRLTAPKTSLLKGETTTLRVEVSGLEGIRQDVPLELENSSPEVISMSGGNSQRTLISPRDVGTGGTYATDRTLTGIQAGPFSITGTLLWSETGSGILANETSTSPKEVIRPDGKDLIYESGKEGAKTFTKIKYDLNGKETGRTITEHYEKDGTKTTVTTGYDDRGRETGKEVVVEGTDRNGRKTRTATTYDGAGRETGKTIVEKAPGKNKTTTTTTTYDGQGRETGKTTVEDKTDDTGKKTKTTTRYDAQGHVVSQTTEP